LFSDWGMVLRDLEPGYNISPDLLRGQKRKWRLSELADDPQFCYAYITAHADKVRR
jgi:hypothetical protein